MARYTFLPIKDTLSQDDNEANRNRINDRSIKFYSLYCLKTIGSFFVICIHCFGPKAWLFYPIIRTAVPFFFIISGFFLYNEDQQKAYDRCVSALKKVFWITLYANIFYYLCYYVPTDLFPFDSTKSVFRYFIVGGTFGFHLWYLNSYLFALATIILSIKLKVLHYLWWCIPLCIMFGLFTGKYGFLFPYLPNDLFHSRNFITIGIPCVGFGWLLKKYRYRLLEIIKYPILLTLAIFLLSELEIVLLKYSGNIVEGDYLATTFPLAVSMVLIGIKYPLIGKGTVIENIGKNYSTYIYIFHLFVLRMFIILNNKILGFPSITYPFVVFLLTLLFIILWKKCSRNFF